MTCKPPLYMGPEYIKYFSDKTIDVSSLPPCSSGPWGRLCHRTPYSEGQLRFRVEVGGAGSLWAPEEDQGHGGSGWGLQRCGEAETRTSVLGSGSSRSLCGPLHCFLSVCGRRSCSGTRGSLGSWSSSPTGPVTASHLLLSTLTSRSSEWDRVGVVEIVPSLSLVWPWFLHSAARGTPNLGYLYLCFIDSFSLAM